MADQPQEPNLFELKSEDGSTRITYSSTSNRGEPELSYSGPMGENAFSGDAIESVTTALGTEHTMTLEAVPDLHLVTLTLLQPYVLIATGETDFRTLAIITTNATSIAGPTGVGQTYQVIALEGSASFAWF